MLMLRVLVLFFLSVPWSFAQADKAFAQPEEAFAAYTAGQYEAAARLGEADGSAPGYALAARAVLASGVQEAGVEPSAEVLRRAQALARRALALDAGNAEARLQLAISLSLETRPMSLRAARRTGYGRLTRDLALSVLRDEPDHPYAHGFLAVWNIEVLRRGGRLGALIMGASLEQGRYHYAEAAKFAPDDGAIHWQWGRVLTATNPKKYRREIDLALAASIASQRDDALEGILQIRAADLRARLDSDADIGAIKAYAASLL